MSTAQDILVEGSNISGAIQLDMGIEHSLTWNTRISNVIHNRQLSSAAFGDKNFVAGFVKETETEDLFLANFLLYSSKQSFVSNRFGKPQLTFANKQAQWRSII